MNLGWGVFCCCCFVLFCFFREQKYAHKLGRGAEGEREREHLQQTPPSAQSPTQGLIPRPWDHDLNQNQELDAQPTEPPRHPEFSRLLHQDMEKPGKLRDVLCSPSWDPRVHTVHLGRSFILDWMLKN